MTKVFKFIACFISFIAAIGGTIYIAAIEQKPMALFNVVLASMAWPTFKSFMTDLGLFNKKEDGGNP